MNNPGQQAFHVDRRPGRPLMGKERRVTLTLTMDPGVADQLRELAYRHDLSCSRFVEMLAIELLNSNRRNQ
ncbi:MAG: hypothetical protein JO250_20790 [Armatimonadetes bacterium]|nr:hypothetical protein [Armatimonadota bacterium]